ncbi:MAG: isoaspartyl peptidase/L-asparaginase, partial [Lutimonas sp.]
VAANQVSSLMMYKGMEIDSAMNQVIHQAIDSLGGDGGMIGIDKKGKVAWEFNSEGMYRGYKTSAAETMIVEFYEKGNVVE